MGHAEDILPGDSQRDDLLQTKGDGSGKIRSSSRVTIYKTEAK